ncbi:MAG: LPXTG cell wall anchor domain-containing protein, partial [Lachnospiraceae bacterium]|nr:LPXTG cell wall anchor domain-containing protein [Lachnospiraceae bacterium]
KPEESDKDEKDDVPKTGEGANAPLMWTLLLLLAAAIAVYGKKWQERHEE